jgi:polar amino acid transport system ATP-binding protein
LPEDVSLPEVILAAEGIGKSFDGHEVLSDISLSVDAGELVSFIGPSGCGKSTFLRCLNLLEHPDRGTVTVAGVTVTREPGRRWTRADERLAHRLRGAVGMVFQSFNLFPHRTVLDNVMLAPVVVKKVPKPQARAQAMALLEKVGLAAVAKRYPPPCRAGSSSAPRSPARWRRSRGSCCMTSRPRRWIRN